MDAYHTLRGTVASYAAPPIDVIIPTITDTDMATPPELPAAQLEAVAVRADRMLPTGDDLRGAIHRWSEWWQHQQTSGARRTIENLVAPLINAYPAMGVTETRAKRLAAWASSRLDAIAGAPSPNDPPPVPTEPGAPRWPLPGAEEPTGMGILAVGLGLVVALAMRKKSRR